MASIEVPAGARGVAIAGPTASGKSGLAAALARAQGGVVINADSMQVYRDLRVLTARPTAAEEAELPHRLYGHVDGAEAYSAARFAEDAARTLAETRALGALPIVVGGTGLYFKSLFQGFAAIPQVPSEVRARWREAALSVPASELHRILTTRDPATAARLNPSDPQRIVRALEVLDATGRPLSSWQADPPRPFEDPEAWVRVVLDPDRAVLAERIAARLRAMADQGALDEVASLRARGLDAALPVMKAIGVAEFGTVLSGAAGLDEAITAAATATRAYAKRQRTFFRTQMAGWIRVAS